MPDETVRCKWCAEEILAAALKCKHCGELVSQVPPPPSIPAGSTPTGGEHRCPKCFAAFALPGELNRHKMQVHRDLQAPTGDAAVICPHCGKRGRVTTRIVKAKKGISGGKATAAVFTAGVSLLGTGLSRKERVTEARCGQCGQVWHY